MTSLIGFIIPVRHPDNIRDKLAHTKNVTSTLDSLLNQKFSDWQCVVVTNDRYENIPDDPRIELCVVNFSKNIFHDFEFDADLDKETW